MYVSLWKRAVLCLACIGMTIPQGALVAADMPQQSKINRVLDVKLTDGGQLSGQLVDAQGKALKNAKVTVRFGSQVVAVAKTNNAGRYAITGLMGGVHQLETENGRVAARLWTAKTAPVTAKPNALIVSDENVIRAQCGDGGCGTGIAGGGIVGGNGGWVVGDACGAGGFYGDGGYYGDGYCYDYAGGGAGFGLGAGALTCLTVAGVITAIAIAADDDDNGRSSP